LIDDDERSDCTKLMNFINGDFEDYSNSCCSGKFANIKFDNENYIIYYSNKDLGEKISDYSTFPYLSRIKELYIIGGGLNEIPDNIFDLTSLKILSIHDNNVEVIPPAVQNLQQLTDLRLFNNNLSLYLWGTSKYPPGTLQIPRRYQGHSKGRRYHNQGPPW